MNKQKIQCTFVTTISQMDTKYFRVNNSEYCHITDDTIFITSGKDPKRIPLEYTLSEAWGIVSILNYFLFTALLIYISSTVTNLGMNFFKKPISYGTLFVLFYSFVRIKNGFITSKTATISRNKIKATYFKTPRFSYPQLVIYFEGPAGKVLKRTIPALYTKEAMPVLTETGLITAS